MAAGHYTTHVKLRGQWCLGDGVTVAALDSAVKSSVDEVLAFGVSFDRVTGELVGAVPGSRVCLHCIPLAVPPGNPAQGVRDWVSRLRAEVGLPGPSIGGAAPPVDPVSVLALVQFQVRRRKSGSLERGGV